MGYQFNPFTGNFDIVPDAAGAAGTPGGSNGQLQYNASGAFAGAAGSSVDASGNVTFGGDVTLSDGSGNVTTLQLATPSANRTITFPDATGTVALVAGSSGQITYNLNGAQAGLSTLTADASGNLSLSARLTNTFNSASAAPAKSWTGTWITGAGTTNTKPHVLIEPAGTTSTAWSNSGTGLGINAASGFAGNLLDLQVNGTSALRATHEGLLAVGTSVISPTLASSPCIGNYFGGLQIAASGARVAVFTGAATPSQGLRIDLGGLVFSANADLALQRDAADTLAQRRTTNAQTFRVYGTFTDASNYVRAALSSTSTAVTLAAETAGSGADDITLNLTGAGTGTVKVNSDLETATKNIVTDTSTGTKIGTSTSQKLGFWNATPVDQPAAVADAVDTTDVVARLNDVLARLRETGLIAT